MRPFFRGLLFHGSAFLMAVILVIVLYGGVFVGMLWLMDPDRRFPNTEWPDLGPVTDRLYYCEGDPVPDWLMSVRPEGSIQLLFNREVVVDLHLGKPSEIYAVPVLGPYFPEFLIWPEAISEPHDITIDGQHTEFHYDKSASGPDLPYRDCSQVEAW